MTTTESETSSPNWGSTLKLVVAFTLVAIVGALVVRFSNIIGPLLLAFILAYVLHPLASWLTKTIRFSWRGAVAIIYLLLVMLLMTLFTVTGLGVVQQIQSLVGVVQRFLNNDLPNLVNNLSTDVYDVGGFFQVDMSQFLGQYDLNALVQQLLDIIQPVLSRTGGLLSTVASRTASTLGWGLFILLVSYFILADGGQVSHLLTGIEIPGYNADIRRLGRRLGRIWNAFMRGQLILFALTVIFASILLTALGVRNSLALAFLAGLARFVPYIGPFVTWTVTWVVSFFQDGNYFGLESFQYALLVLIVIVILDQIFDNLVTPRLYGRALGVHPAALLVAAIVAANLIGFVGLLLAAPVLATLSLFSCYAFRKMLDLDPWPETELEGEGKIEFPGASAARRLWLWVWPRVWVSVRQKVHSWSRNEQENV